MLTKRKTWVRGSGFRHYVTTDVSPECQEDCGGFKTALKQIRRPIQGSARDLESGRVEVTAAGRLTCQALCSAAGGLCMAQGRGATLHYRTSAEKDAWASQHPPVPTVEAGSAEEQYG